MSMHKKPLTPLEEKGLRTHGLAIGSPSQLSDVFRHGVAWALRQAQAAPEAEPVTKPEYYLPEYAGSGQRGVCIKCNKGPTSEGHDGCLGTLPGPIMNACCGHGRDSQAYIQYWDGTSVRGDEAVIEQARLINATQRHDAELVELLRETIEDRSGAIHFMGTDLLDRIDAKLATLSAKP